MKAAPERNFPWKTLPEKLYTDKLVIRGWPYDCPLPLPCDERNKGISGLSQVARRALAASLQDGTIEINRRDPDHPLTSRKSST